MLLGLILQGNNKEENDYFLTLNLSNPFNGTQRFIHTDRLKFHVRRTSYNFTNYIEVIVGGEWTQTGQDEGKGLCLVGFSPKKRKFGPSLNTFPLYTFLIHTTIPDTVLTGGLTFPLSGYEFDGNVR